MGGRRPNLKRCIIERIDSIKDECLEISYLFWSKNLLTFRFGGDRYEFLVNFVDFYLFLRGSVDDFYLAGDRNWPCSSDCASIYYCSNAWASCSLNRMLEVRLCDLVLPPPFFTGDLRFFGDGDSLFCDEMESRLTPCPSLFLF